ncbi:RagB/SusD family nutrient uptake outer membrane protein [Prevotella sp. KH2C16]|uniref:RagB/SusD family nutrient uptake outer membrane protein n=1 Tax=Prevotella sp. KH2C16 TaxID=1855325 RepID=UPI000B852452|nr:RagB/SusD family nutrient uptake outer membrane protein [Prevotella sp. KH2C16]
MKKYIIVLSILGLVSSCNNFLDEIPKGETTTESYYKTPEQAVAATNAIYDYLIIGYSPNGLWDENYGGVFYNYYWIFQDLFSDNANSNMSGSDYTSIDNLQIDQYNTPLKLLWRDFYQTIKCCNIVLDKVSATEMDITLKNNLLGEARFWRAMMYFDLVRMFGDVPFRTHDIEGADEERIGRTSSDIIYQQIIEDLKFAEENLKYSDRQGGGRPYALSATALLARVYNTYAYHSGDKSYYQKAIDCAKKVIPAFPLMADFGDLFKIENRFNSEIILGINFNTSLSEGWKGGQFLVRLLPNTDTSKGGPNNAQGWENATEDLYESFSSSDKRRDITLKRSFTYNDGTQEDLKKPYIFKYWDRTAEPNGNNTDAIFPAIRTSEMYLIIAEASNELNKGANAEAVSALEAVRTRAGLTSDGISNDYASFKTAVLNEYRHEFVMEGHRWFDLTRMCSPDEFVQRIKAAKPNSNPQTYEVLFPIPQREIALSGGVLTQNEGYK